MSTEETDATDDTTEQPATRNGEVSDEEGFVDRKKKETIIQNRQEIKEWNKKLFSNEKMGGISYEEAVSLWRDRVVEYLVSIEPLLNRENLPLSTEAYTEWPLGYVEFELPEEYQQQRATSINDLVGRESHYLTGNPETTKTVTVRGLKTVIERETVAVEWTLKRRQVSGPPVIEEITHREEVPMPKHILLNAVRMADDWLQQAGIGLAFAKKNHGKI